MIRLKIEKRNFSISFSKAFLISPGYSARYCSKQQWWGYRPVLGGARGGAELLFWGEILPSPIKRAGTEKIGSIPLGLGFTPSSKFFPVPILSGKKPAPLFAFPIYQKKPAPAPSLLRTGKKSARGLATGRLILLHFLRAEPFLPSFFSSFLSFLLVSGLIVSSSAEVK